MTKSKIKRRSGTAAVNVLELLGWQPDLIVQVGVGINHGEVYAMRDSWPLAKFVGYEPNPGTLRAIKRTYPGQLFGYAIGDDDKPAILHSKARHKDGSSLHRFRQEHGHERYSEVAVVMSRLDTLHLVEPYASGVRDQPRTMLWLDCEGSELDVLRGGPRFLAATQVVNVEMTSRPPGPNWCSPLEVHEHLMAAGFLRQAVHTNRTVAGQCDALYVRRELFRPELCCCPCQLKENPCDRSST